MTRIRQLRLYRYKAFRHRQTIDLAPLTLLYGYNNTGKSAAVRALPALAASIDKKAAPLDLEPGGVLQGAGFSEVVWKRGLELQFGLRWEDMDACWTLRADPNTGAHWVDEINVRHRDEHHRIRFMGDGYLSDAEAGEPFSLRFVGLLPDESFAGDAWVNPLRGRLDQVRDQVAWVPGWRGDLERDPRVPSAVASSLRFTGLHAQRLLIHDAVHEKSSLLRDITPFFEELGFAPAVRPPVKERTAVTLARAAGLPVNLMDAGEGMAQVLPVLVALARARAGEQPTVCIEQPELHLHPKAQRVLAQRIVSAATSTAPNGASPTLLIETHSQHLMLCVQRAVVRGELPPELVKIYWVRQHDDGSSSLDPVELDQSGRDRGHAWPPDVFNDDTRLAREIIEARRARGL